MGKREMLRSGWMRGWKDLGWGIRPFSPPLMEEKACGWFPKRKQSEE